MSNRFTDKAERVLNNAATIAESLGHTYIGSEHVLLSLCKERDTVAVNALNKNGATYEKALAMIKDYSGAGAKSVLTPNDMTPRCRKIVENSYRISLRYGALKIGTEHILLAILEEKDCVGVRLLALMGVDTLTLSDEILTVLRTAEKHFEVSKGKKENESPLSLYGRNLTELAGKNKFDPVIGREKETERLIRILSRKTKNNPCLIGEAGVGKTAIVEGLARRIYLGEVPEKIKGKNIISVDLTSMVAGAKYRGDFEERIKGIINEAASNPSVILFIDEIHTIVGAGSAEGAIDAANILKPQLSRSEIQLIGATTFNEYHKYIEKDAALERRFQPLLVEEPDVSASIEILKGVRERYEDHHSVIITDEAIEAAVRLSERYIQDRFLPDKALDVIDEACAKANVASKYNKIELISEKIRQNNELASNALRKNDSVAALKFRDKELELKAELGLEHKAGALEKRRVERHDVEEIVSELTGISVNGMSAGKDQSILFEKITARVCGQNMAAERLCKAVARSEMGMGNPDRPKGVFLFVGPSGVGKTEMAKAISDELYKDKRSLIRFDMSEFSEKNSVSALIGSPPGYVGYEEGGSLTEKIRRRPYSLVLFDEIEKAHPEVLNLFLQIMDEGSLTDSMGRSVSFKNAYIIMTSNAHSATGTVGNLGFVTSEASDNSYLLDHFTPEFINRIDCIVEFSALGLESLTEVALQKMNSLKEKMKKCGVEIDFDNAVAEYLAKKSLDKRLGVRALLRLIADEIESEISSRLLGGDSMRYHICINNEEIRIEASTMVGKITK